MTFYVLNIALNPGLGIGDVQSVLGYATSYYRIAPNCWVFVASETSDAWFNRLQHLARPSGRLFICRLQPWDKQGWMDEEFWDWMRSHGG